MPCAMPCFSDELGQLLGIGGRRPIGAGNVGAIGSGNAWGKVRCLGDVPAETMT